MKNNAQLTKELRLLKERLEQLETPKSNPNSPSDQPSLNPNEELQSSNQTQSNTSGDNTPNPNDNKPSLFTRIKTLLSNLYKKVSLSEDTLNNLLIYLSYVIMAVKLLKISY